MDDLPKRIQAARAYAGLSQTALAEKLGFSTSTIKRIESGDRTEATGVREMALIQGVAEATGLPRDFFTVDFSELREMQHASWKLEQLKAQDIDTTVTHTVSRKQIERIEAMLDRILAFIGDEPDLATALDAVAEALRERLERPGEEEDATGS